MNRSSFAALLLCPAVALAGSVAPGGPGVDAGVNPDAEEVLDGVDAEGEPAADPDWVWGGCPLPTETTTCTIDMNTGLATCDNGDPTRVVSTSAGLSLRLDMSDWTVVAADFDIANPTGYVLNFGNSPSNNGWNGDGSQFSNDTEAQLFNNSMALFPNDLGGGASVLNAVGVDPAGDLATAVVCDGYYRWISSVSDVELASPTIFQIDGDELDPQAGGLNDQVLWLGVNRIIRAPDRRGFGVSSVTLTFGR